MKTKFILMIVLLMCISACATQKGYDYKTHHRKSAHAKPSKCYKQHKLN